MNRKQYFALRAFFVMALLVTGSSLLSAQTGGASAVTDAVGNGPMYAGAGTNTALLFEDIPRNDKFGLPLPLQVLGDTTGEWLKVKIAGPYWYPGVGGKSWKEGYMKREHVRLLPANGPGKPVRFVGAGHGMLYTWGEYLPIAFTEAELEALPHIGVLTAGSQYTYEGSKGWRVGGGNQVEENWGESIIEAVKVNNPELLHYLLATAYFGYRGVGGLEMYDKGERVTWEDLRDPSTGLSSAHDVRYILSRVYDPDDPPRAIGTSSPAVPAAPSAPATAEYETAYDASGSGLVITKYKGQWVNSFNGPGGSVTIPAAIGGKKVTAIGELAFADSGITTAVIPEGVTEIGSSAFASCQFLTDVVLPKSLTAIRSGAFSRCGKLQNITIPGSVTTVEGGVFIGCNSLSEATVTAIVARFGSDPFSK